MSFKNIKNRIVIFLPLFLKISVLTMLTIFCFYKIKNKDVRNTYLLILMLSNVITLNYEIYKRRLEIKMLKMVGVARNHILIELLLEYLLVIAVSNLVCVSLIHINYSILNFMIIQNGISLITIFINTNYLLSNKKREVMIDE